MAALPQGRVVHFAARRLRVKIPEKRHDEQFFARVGEQLSAWDSIERIEVNPLTASVLVFFEDIVALFAEHDSKNDLFSVNFDELDALAGEAGPNLVDTAAQRVLAADAALRQLSAGSADLRTVIFLVLLGGGLYQLVRGSVPGRAVPLLWYAGEMLHLRDRMARSAGADYPATRG